MQDDMSRFLKRVIPEPNSGCWIWFGAANEAGYGTLMRSGVRMGAHRYSYFLHHGPAPDGKMVCHRCDFPPCVNPDHLFVGSGSDNFNDALSKGRAISIGAVHAAKNKCPQGHEYTGRNLISYRGRRYCRACKNAYGMQRMRKIRREK